MDLGIFNLIIQLAMKIIPAKEEEGPVDRFWGRWHMSAAIKEREKMRRNKESMVDTPEQRRLKREERQMKLEMIRRKAEEEGYQEL